MADRVHLRSNPAVSVATCHIEVTFQGYPPLHYHADAAAARRLADALRGHADVVIDDDLSDVAKPLPCERLWHP
ncbi:MAG: hypothetical protein HOQ24_10635 [Mycobacteriaceae bacterium]|nr:hypothetical protein [Mycobacteriaceae bacterium]